jgi:hypothetical protein
MHAEIPDIDKKDVEISMTDNLLTIKGHTYGKLAVANTTAAGLMVGSMVGVNEVNASTARTQHRHDIRGN